MTARWNGTTVVPAARAMCDARRATGDDHGGLSPCDICTEQAALVVAHLFRVDLDELEEVLRSTEPTLLEEKRSPKLRATWPGDVPDALVATLTGRRDQVTVLVHDGKDGLELETRRFALSDGGPEVEE